MFGRFFTSLMRMCTRNKNRGIVFFMEERLIRFFSFLFLFISPSLLNENTRWFMVNVKLISGLWKRVPARLGTLKALFVPEEKHVYRCCIAAVFTISNVQPQTLSGSRFMQLIIYCCCRTKYSSSSSSSKNRIALLQSSLLEETTISSFIFLQSSCNWIIEINVVKSLRLKFQIQLFIYYFLTIY